MNGRWIVIFILVLLLGWFLYPSPKKPVSPAASIKTPQEKIVKPEKKNPVTQALMPPPTPQPAVSPVAFSKNAPPGAVYFKVQDGWAVAQGDILIGKLANESRDLEEGYFKADKMKTWPQNEIAVIIDPNLPDPDRIEQALKEIEAVSPFRFVPFTNQKDGFVFEQTDELCASYLGRVGGFQPIVLARHCNKQQIMHEVMHALGFPHEHSRPERDRYIHVNWDNIIDDFRPQFDLLPTEMLPVIFPTAFDYQSIMLYPSNAFAKSGDLITLQSLDSNHVIAPIQEGLSRTDIKRLHWLAKSAKSPDANTRPRKD